MTNQEIAEFLETTRIQIQTAIDEKFRPVYKSNTWLRQKDLTSNERIIMQLVDEHNGRFTIKWLVDQTGLTRKCIGDNCRKLVTKQLIRRVEGTYDFEAISIV